jgi:hypothetical protein
LVKRGQTDVSFNYRSRFLLPLLLVLATIALPATALAHERRTVAAGKYDVVVGWDIEPTFQSEKNAATIRITQAGSDPAVPVEGADKTLKVQIRQGAQTRDFSLRAVFGQAGYYAADIVPTRAGDYIWTFVGAINGDQFDSADGKFDSVQPPTSLEFPLALPDPAQSASAAQAAQSDGQTTRLLAYGSLALAALGLIVGAAGWITRSRVVTNSSPPAAPPERVVRTAGG